MPDQFDVSDAPSEAPGDETVEVALTFSGHTDTGRVRAVNEDSFLGVSPVFIVADGMGGHAFGDRASRAAVAAFARAFADREPTRPERVLDVIRTANADVRAISPDVDGRTVSGTTLAGVALVRAGRSDQCHWMVFNVGDSRVYSWDGRSLEQLSVDHSVVQELIDDRLITPEQARTHPARNVVTRALGASDAVDADVWLLPGTTSRTFVICSDGLTKELTTQEIARTIAVHGAAVSPAASLAETLVGAAVAAGGSDNVTVIVVESTAERLGQASADTHDRDQLPEFLQQTMPRGAG